MRGGDPCTRRDLLGLAAAGVAAAVSARCSDAGAGRDPRVSAPDASDRDSGGSVASRDAEPTPQCFETEDNALGPAYVPDAPFRRELNSLGWPGTPLRISGRVRGTSCAAIAGATLDVWQAADDGHYDGSPLDPDRDPSPHPAYPLRGRLTTDGEGRYEFTTILPGLYPGRTRHIHVLVTAPGYRQLITQIYFSGESANANDGLIEPELVIDLSADPATGGRAGVFDVVLARPV